ncbi:uncharacterized protein [Musca autumnalis]|uniref:uncharacterized protein n=1 Tax=Musca autumnalis TaxID=221902 RepID=UPI003CEF0178
MASASKKPNNPVAFSLRTALQTPLSFLWVLAVPACFVLIQTLIGVTTPPANEINVEIEWLKNEILPKLLEERKLIADIDDADLEKFQIVDITIDFIGIEEAFMLTRCYRTKIVYDLKGVTNEIHLFVKKTPQIPQQLFDVINFKALFTNDILGYEKILPAIEDFAKSNLNVVKFYYGNLQTNAGTLITSDFGSLGWRVTKDRVNLSLEHTLLAVKYLAKFHAAGFALKITNEDKFNELTEGLLESRYANEINHPQILLKFDSGRKRIIKATKQYQNHVPEEFLQKFDNLVSNHTEYGRKVLKPKEPFVTLCHGDYLRNNVAYKYQDDDPLQPTEVMMYDLQTLRVASPMIDLTTFLGFSNFAKVRHEHFKEIFEAYCRQLGESFEEYAKIPVPDYLSFDSLLKEYIRCLPNVVYISSWFLPDLVEPTELTPAEMMTQQPSDEEVIQDCMTRGGEVLDRELAHQMKELYELAAEHNVDIFI